MKVKVTHTARYDDVPNIVNELVNKCRTELTRCSELKFDILRLEDTATEVSKIQETLDLVSSQLEDCLHLCNGYVQVQQQLADAKANQEIESDVATSVGEQDEVDEQGK
jgi:hypothetical protein